MAGIRLVDIQQLFCSSVFVNGAGLTLGLMAALLHSVEKERCPCWAGGGAEGPVGLGLGWPE